MSGAEFIGREHELSLLEKEYAKDSSFVLMTGRRRIGKTRLIKEFIEGKDALYFFCNEVNRSSLLEELSGAITAYCGVPFSQFGNWADAFRMLATAKGGRKIVVLDEFQNMIKADETVVTYMQDIWDSILSSCGVMLILCGSHITVMEKLAKHYKSPLYGRFTRRITLTEIPFSSVCGSDYVESVRRYAIHGGVPKYMELMGDAPYEVAVEEQILDSSSIMFDDPRTLISSEMKESTGYLSVLKSIAMGNHKITDISSNLQVSSTSLGYTLGRLMEIGLIARDVPVTEDPEKSKNGLYVLRDNYTAFWFKFVYPYYSMLLMGHSEGAMQNLRRHFGEAHAAFVFEEICRESIRSMAYDIGFIPEKVGRYWDRGKVEIDIMALDTEGKQAFVAECKFHDSSPMDVHDLHGLMAKCSDVRALDGYRIKYGLFSVTGFDQRLYGMDVMLVDKGLMVSGH